MATNLLNSGRKPEFVYFIKGKRFESLNDAAATNGVNKATITRWCKSDKKSDCYREPVDNVKITMGEVEDEAKKQNKPAKQILEEIANDPDTPLNVKAQVCNWLLPYQEAKVTVKQGKKQEREDKAKGAGRGKFSSGPPPLRAVK